MTLLRLAEDAAVETGVVTLEQLTQRADLQQRKAAAEYKTMQQQTAALIIQKESMLSNVTKYTMAAADAKKQAGVTSAAEELEAAKEALEAAVVSGDAAALAQAEEMVALAEAKMHAEAKGSSKAIMDDITRLNGTPDVEELLEAAEVMDTVLTAL